MKKTNKAVVVFSGGQDSTICLLQALKIYDSVSCITFDYGQRHKEEIKIAKNIIKKLNVNMHEILDISILNNIAISSLTRNYIDIPKYIKYCHNKVPNTFVPGRNILFLILASIYAYQIEADTVIIGVCETDFSGYPDCRDKFIKTLNKAVCLGINKEINFKTPLMWLTKAEIWALADNLGELNFIINETLTCYSGIKGYGCKKCDACYLRNSGLDEYLFDKNKIINRLKKKNNSTFIINK